MFVKSLVHLAHQAGHNMKTILRPKSKAVGYNIVKPGVEALKEKEMGVPLASTIGSQINHWKHVLTRRVNPTQQEVGIEIAVMLTILAQLK